MNQFHSHLILVVEFAGRSRLDWGLMDGYMSRSNIDGMCSSRSSINVYKCLQESENINQLPSNRI